VCEEDVLVTTFPIRWANASEEVLEGDAEANGSPVKESGDAPELLSRTSGIDVEPTVSWEATANVQQGEPLVSIKGCQLVEECNRQHEMTSDSDFTKKLLEELSGIFGKQTTIPTSTLLPSDRINAADSSIVAKDQSSIKKGSIATWIELINAIGNMLRRSSDSSPPQSASHDVNPVNGVSNDGTTQKRLRPFKSSNSASQWFDDYVRNPMIGDSESQYTAATRQLDTGGTNFNRLILSEDESTGNPFFGKFIRKGFDWSDGNLRLVDMEGNKLLGSELTVHDRSVDIPLQPWLEAVDSFFRPYPQNEPFIVENVY
uniref:Anti-silencing factor n=2 Tax=Parascaris univalens TaxID=6257 RepID=A0A914ZFS1_PARUN